MTGDWATKAARVIMLQYALKSVAPQDTSVYRLSQIIRDHCPSLPRCDGCKHWDAEDVTIMGTAECTLVDMSAVVQVGSTGETIRFQMRTKKDFGCVRWEAK